MKLTWFGGTCLRLHAGGAILVVDPDAAPAGIDRGELVAGADRVIEDLADLPPADAAAFRPRAVLRLIEETDTPRPPQLWRLGADTAIVDADGERPLILMRNEVPELGRWAEKSVVLLSGGDMARRAAVVVDKMAPRLLALAGPDTELDAVFETLGGLTGETALMALERGLAVEC